MIRYRLGEKSFCSKRCRDKYRADTDRTIFRIKKWTEFLSEKP